MHPDLEEAIEFHDAIIAEGGKALIGYEPQYQLDEILTQVIDYFRKK